MYKPNKWVILELTDSENDKSVYKILAGWTGGYLDGDSWRLSSGLKNIEKENEYYLMYNHSGSIYKCHKKSKGLTVFSAAIYQEIKNNCEKSNIKVKIVTIDEFNKKNVD